MARAKGNEPYNLDGILNIEQRPRYQELSQYPLGKGNTDLDGIESVEANSSLTWYGDDAFPRGKTISMDAVTEIPGGNTTHEQAIQNTFGANCLGTDIPGWEGGD